MKRLFTLMGAAVLAMCCVLQVFANEYDVTEETLVSEQEYAYMDIETASEEEREKILAAREKIIYQSSWSADNVEGLYIHPDGTVEELPKFSELFPDWEIPTVEVTEVEDALMPTAPDETVDAEVIPLTTKYYTYNPYLNSSPSSSDTSPFCAIFLLPRLMSAAWRPARIAM